MLDNICVSLFLLQSHPDRLENLRLGECSLTVDQLVDLVRHVSPPEGLPHVKMEDCELIHHGEAPSECLTTPDEQPVCVTHLDIKDDTELTLAALEAVTHSLNVTTLVLKVSNDHSNPNADLLLGQHHR